MRHNIYGLCINHKKYGRKQLNHRNVDFKIRSDDEKRNYGKIAKDFLNQMNPEMWDGNGEKPESVNTKIWEYDLCEYRRLINGYSGNM